MSLRKLVTPEFQKPAQSPAPASWFCKVCGEVEPLLLPSGRWIERSCACQRKAKNEERAREERAKRLKEMAVYTYGGWLGEGWYSPKMNLSNQTFENYDADRLVERNQLRQVAKMEGDPDRRKAFISLLRDFEADCKVWRTALAAAREFATNPKGVLLFRGSYGLGKSHLLAAVCNSLREQANPVSSLFVTGPRFFSAFYDRMNHDHDEWMLVNQAISTPFFVFDDLDKIGPKDFRKEVFFQIIDERCNAGKPIGISTNNMENLPAYIGEAAYSRLKVGLKQVDLQGEDYRSKVEVS